MGVWSRPVAAEPAGVAGVVVAAGMVAVVTAVKEPRSMGSMRTRS
jgi:hypothetical protein